MSMSDRDGYIWYDGKLVPWRSATTHVLTHSLHYGKYCCDKCRQSGWILARAAKILFQLEPAEWFAILDAVRVKTAAPKTPSNGRGKRAEH